MLKTFAAAAAFCAVGAVSALALPTDFSGSGSGSFDAGSLSGAFNTCVGSGGGGSDNVLGWGSVALSCPGGGWLVAPDSTLSIDNVAFSQNFAAPGTEHVKVAQLTWFNSSTPGWTTPNNFSIDGALSVNIVEPGVFNLDQPLTFTVGNTVNPAGDVITAATFTNFGQSLPLSLGGDLFLVSFSTMLSGSGALDNLGGGTFQWTNPEKGVSTLEILAKIQAVPLPAAAWMLIAGVAGLGALSRAQRKAV
jgi:hypothetical protein